MHAQPTNTGPRINASRNVMLTSACAGDDNVDDRNVCRFSWRALRPAKASLEAKARCRSREVPRYASIPA